MKIEKLVIYGFGKHEDVTIELCSDMNVLYGSNEAGKTTIQQFILHVLFGFPQKNSTLLRYEPKMGGKYGGQVHLLDEQYGKCTVERIRGKSAGEVEVRLEDGTTGGEELLTQVMHQYDRSSYESIFSFSLLQLQGFEKMDEDELSRTLLASGTMGVDTLFKVEKKLDSELGELFKKSGRKPEMNSKLAELRTLEAELKVEMDKIETYEPAVNRLRSIEEKLLTLRTNEADIKKDAKKQTLLRQVLPLHRKRQSIERQLADYQHVRFPVDGIRRFEELKGRLRESEATSKKIENELREATSQLTQPSENDRLEKMEILLAKESEWLNWHTIVGTSIEEQQRLVGRRGRLLDRLGVKTEDKQQALLQADVSIQQEEQMHGLLSKLKEHEQQISFTRHQLATTENDCTTVEQSLKQHKQVAPTNAERETALKWSQDREQLAEAKAFVSIAKPSVEKNSFVIPIILLVVALSCIVVGFVRSEWFMLGVGVVLCAASGLYVKTQKSTVDEVKLKEMKQLVAKYQGTENELTSLLERIADFDQTLHQLHQNYKVAIATYENVKKQLDELDDNRQQTEQQMVAFLTQYGMSSMPSSDIIPELFAMIRELQEIERDREQVTNQIEKIEERIKERLAQITETLGKEVPSHSVYEMLRRAFLALKEQSETVKRLSTTIETTEKEYKNIVAISNALQLEKTVLMTEADATTDSEFYESAERQQEEKRLATQLEDLHTQLTVHGPLDIDQHLSDSDLIEKQTQLDNKLATISEELNHLVNEKAALTHKTDQLLTEGTLGEKRQLFEMKKAEFMELAKKWSERKAITEAIQLTMNELREKKLPQVLKQANSLFSDLTDDAYVGLDVNEAGTFEAVAATGMRYPIVELSQATKEQAYISLRLSLASSLMDTAPFPILMDDPFVHFDGERLSRMIQLLDKLRNTHQFIYFTCHETMKDKWQKATILNVSEIGN